MVETLETRQDQNAEFDQINANDVEFDMDKYEVGDKPTEAEKKEYEKLNKKFRALQDELYQMGQDPDYDQVMDIVNQSKQSHVFSIADGVIHYATAKGDDFEVYDLIGSTSRKRPALYQSEYKGRFSSQQKITNYKELSVEGYDQMLKKVEESVNQQKTLLNQVKNQNKKQESDFINSL